MTKTFPVVYIAEPLLALTGAILVSFADRADDSEGIVYWFGLELGERAVVTSLVVPDADTSFGDVVTSPAANAEALGAIVATPLVLLGQAHSHPRGNVRHSTVDDRETFAQFPGALSVVVPCFGRRGVELGNCGVHRHLDGRYRRIASSKVAAHLRVLPGLRDYRRHHGAANETRLPEDASAALPTNDIVQPGGSDD